MAKSLEDADISRSARELDPLEIVSAEVVRSDPEHDLITVALSTSEPIRGTAVVSAILSGPEGIRRKAFAAPEATQTRTEVDIDLRDFQPTRASALLVLSPRFHTDGYALSPATDIELVLSRRSGSLSVTPAHEYVRDIHDELDQPGVFFRDGAIGEEMDLGDGEVDQ